MTAPRRRGATPRWIAKGEQRSNDTHASTTDADARLFRTKPIGQAKLTGQALLCFATYLPMGSLGGWWDAHHAQAMGYVRAKWAKRPANRPQSAPKSQHGRFRAAQHVDIQVIGVFTEHFFNGLLLPTRMMTPPSSAQQLRPSKGIGNISLERLGQYAAQRHLSLFEAAFAGDFQKTVGHKQLEDLLTFCQFIAHMQQRAVREPARQLLHDLLAAIQYEMFLYEVEGPRAADVKWENVMNFTAWLARKGESDKVNLLQLTQTVTLISMLEDREEEIDAGQAFHPTCRQGPRVWSRFYGRG